MPPLPLPSDGGLGTSADQTSSSSFGARNAEASPYPGMPLQIVGVVDNKIQVIEEALEKVVEELSRFEVQSMAIVSVCGPLRTGKSFLLDLFIRYLTICELKPSVNENKDSTEWLDSEDVELEDAGLFKWRASVERTTEGIWFYSRPFVLQQDDGSKVSVLLMDTQGLFDHKTDKQINNTVFGLSTLLSSLQILNVQNRIQENTLEELHLFTEFCHTALRKLLETSSDILDAGGDVRGRLQTLEFLIRDWPSFGDPDNVAMCESSATAYLQECLAERSHDDGGSRERILESYDDVRCFMLPHPGKQMTRLTWDGSVGAIDDDFKALVNRYVRRVFNENLPPKRSLAQAVKMDPKMLKHYVPALVEAFAADGTPKAESVVKSLAKSINGQAREASLAKYKEKMSLPKGEHLADDELEARHEAALAKALATFESIATFGDAEDRTAAEQMLRNEVDGEHTRIERLNKLEEGKLLVKYAPAALVMVLAYGVDKFSDFACDWWLDGCKDLSGLLWFCYVFIFTFLSYNVYDTYSSKGSVVAIQSATGLGNAALGLGKSISDQSHVRIREWFGLPTKGAAPARRVHGTKVTMKTSAKVD